MKKDEILQTRLIVLLPFARMSASTSQLHLSVCNELGDFISQTKAFSYRVRVSFRSKKKHYESKVRIHIYKHFPNVHHNNYWLFVSGHMHKVCSDLDLNILCLHLVTLQAEVESLYNSYD